MTGATGLIGSALVPLLLERGDAVTVLSRDAARAKAKLGGGVEAVTADLETPGAWSAALAGAGAVVHLAGESVAGKRWDARQKQIIRDSRVEATRTLVEEIAKLTAADRPGVLISASGVDFYPFALPGEFDDDEVTERDPVGDSFLARVCRDWEREAVEATQAGLRVAMMRIGLVLAKDGALAKMSTAFKWFVGGKLGNGKQWVPWIHLDDAAAAFATAVHDERYRGPINLVTDSVRNRELSAAIGRALGRPSLVPVPGFALKLAVGELAPYLLEGRRVVPKRLRELGFTWKHPELAEAVSAAI
ncbi:MAG TPA: TIGR01777 family oxidoreductase [Kofleriaceae bacterium]